MAFLKELFAIEIKNNYVKKAITEPNYMCYKPNYYTLPPKFWIIDSKDFKNHHLTS